MSWKTVKQPIPDPKSTKQNPLPPLCPECKKALTFIECKNNPQARDFHCYGCRLSFNVAKMQQDMGEIKP
jgi:hypothetical protein